MLMNMPVVTRLLITSCYMVLVIALSVTPGDERATLGWVVYITPSLVQKLLHIAVYAGLGVLWMWVLESRRARVVLVVVISVAFSVSLEVAQAFIPGRFGNVFDVGLNGLGTGIGLAAYPAIHAWLRGQSHGL